MTVEKPYQFSSNFARLNSTDYNLLSSWYIGYNVKVCHDKLSLATEIEPMETTGGYTICGCPVHS